jgi:adenylate kinase family enzyme
MIELMKDFIFIAGAPGSGKSTVAKALHDKLNSPIFEFGWIPVS